MWQAKRRSKAPIATLFAATLLVVATFGLPGTAALFTTEYPITAGISAGRVFPGERDTPAFAVIDASSGSPVDASNAFAHANDNITATTSAWATEFAADRYLEFELNGPLPSGLGVASASLAFSWASASPGSTACFFFELRSESSGDFLEAHGDSSTPVACVTGTTASTTTTGLSSVGTTTVANDLRVRVYGRDSAAGGILVDAATISGDYGLATFTLYPIELRDSADTSPSITRWGLAGP